MRAAPIVGLRAFKYTSEGNLKTFNIPDGAIVDGAAPGEIEGKIQATRISINTDTFEPEP